MKTLLKLVRTIKFKFSPSRNGHIAVIDRRTHEHLTAGWHQGCNIRGKLHWMMMAPEVDKFIQQRGGRVLPNNLEGVSTFLDFPPSEYEQDQYMLHRIAFPDVESVVEFKLRFL